MKKLLIKIKDALANAALLEMGVSPDSGRPREKQSLKESLEENLVEIAYAEAADYDQIHEAIRREHGKGQEQTRPDDCQYGDNDICFAH